MFNDQPPEEMLENLIFQLDQRNIILNWQFGMMLMERQKLIDFLSQFDCPFEIHIYEGDCSMLCPLLPSEDIVDGIDITDSQLDESMEWDEGDSLWDSFSEDE